MLSTTRRCQSLAIRRIPSIHDGRGLTRSQPLRYRSDRSGNSLLSPTTQEALSWRRPTARGAAGNLQERGLATAVDDFKPFYDNGFPFPPAARPSPRFYDLRPIESHIILEDPSPGLPRVNTSRHAISGDVAEMLSIFDACCHVGKVERAGLVLLRLSSKFPQIERSEIMALHNQYIRAALDQLLASPSAAKADSLHNWYELYIQKPRLPQTNETIAMMLKAALLQSSASRSSASDTRQERLVKRYMGMAPGDEDLNVFASDILSDHDRAMIAQKYPKFNVLIGESASSANGEDAAPEVIVEAPMPQVKATTQKGFGLASVSKALRMFTELPEGQDIASLPMEARKELQLRLEKDCVDAAVERWKEDYEAMQKLGLSTAASSPSLNSRLYEWHLDLEAKLSDEVKKLEGSEAAVRKTKEDIYRCFYGPLLMKAKPHRLAALTILSVVASFSVQKSGEGSLPAVQIIKSLAKNVDDDVNLQDKVEEMKAGHSPKAIRQLAQQLKSRRIRVSKEKKAEGEAATMSLLEALGPGGELGETPQTLQAALGSICIQALMETAKIRVTIDDPKGGRPISQMQPAFIHSQRYHRGKKIRTIVPNTRLMEILSREPRFEFLTRHLPMVCEPNSWTDFDKGGYLVNTSHLVRVKGHDSEQKTYARVAIERGDADQLFKGLDVLGKTPWRINQPVLRAMLDAWNTGEAIADLPPLNPQVDYPPEPEPSEDPMVRRKWLQSVRQAENLRGSYHSQRCNVNFQLEIARAYKDHTFYFPHNIDFRGRAYPVPAYFNHMGADNMRGLMMFGKGKELGEAGLMWLKVHLANKFGFDKASLKAREDFTTAHYEDVMDSANNPLNGKRWWMNAEDPWQCLATCVELRDALALPDPTKFVSHLPVHQDGTCNGLQHYAALGGDSMGARQVNLEPGQAPADVYQAVADMVSKQLEIDQRAGHPMAASLIGKISRKVVKQTVMTNVYGVTFTGAKKQIKKQIDDLYPTLSEEMGYGSQFIASYIALNVFRSLGTMFSGAHDIQTWLGEIGGRVCRTLTVDQILRLQEDRDKADAKAMATVEYKKKQREAKKKHSKKNTSNDVLFDEAEAKTDIASARRKYRNESLAAITDRFQSTIIWTTPLRFPVVQPYRKMATKTVFTCLQSMTMTIPGAGDPVDRRKQLQAFPPNFIHSLDASHMMLSALECGEQGLSFAAVHDSFWTHAADVPQMNTVLRDAFIRIHGEDVIGRLASEFQARYRDALYLAPVRWTEEAANLVVAWRTENRMSLVSELLLEKKRQDLLNSEDPALVAQGKEMVTPASIFDITDSEVAPCGYHSALPNMSSEALSQEARRRTPLTEEGIAAAEQDNMDAMNSGEFGVFDEPEDLPSMVDEDDDVEASGKTAAELAEELKAKAAERLKGLTNKVRSIHVWLPLTFPDIPAKGDFDVKRLKESQYFFS